MAKVAKKDKSVIIKELAENLLKNLGIEAGITVVGEQGRTIKEEGETISVNLETGEPGLLIGFHGETLASFQLILSLMVFRKLGEWLRIIVDVAGYRQQRQSILERMALSAAQKAVFSKEPCSLPPMRAFERRIIHLALANHPEVKTESEGEGRERRVVVRPQ